MKTHEAKQEGNENGGYSLATGATTVTVWRCWVEATVALRRHAGEFRSSLCVKAREDFAAMAAMAIKHLVCFLSLREGFLDEGVIR